MHISERLSATERKLPARSLRQRQTRSTSGESESRSSNTMSALLVAAFRLAWQPFPDTVPGYQAKSRTAPNRRMSYRVDAEEIAMPAPKERPATGKIR
jgi:hypothetical protein